MTVQDRNVDDDAYDEIEERLRREENDQDDQDDQAYFPVEESKPPHY